MIPCPLGVSLKATVTFPKQRLFLAPIHQSPRPGVRDVSGLTYYSQTTYISDEQYVSLYLGSGKGAGAFLEASSAPDEYQIRSPN